MVRLKDGRAQLVDALQRRRAGARLVYRVDLNAIDSDALFVAGIPEFLNVTAPAIIRAPGDAYRLTFIPSQGVRYEVWSFIGEPATDGFEQAAVLRGPYLQLPPIDPRVAELARKVTLGQNSDEGRARALEYYLRRNYGYTLDLLSRDVPDPLADFLFERKKGHCEYFASAMTVMLRSLGIPARLVNGFQGGTLNPVSELYVIRASDAHSWVEGYIRGRGWTTFDPTPPDSSPRAASLWSRLGFYLDAAETFWQEWVLSYDLSRQVELAGRMERSSTRFGLRWLDIFTDASSVQWRDTAKSVLAGYGAWFVGLLALTLAIVIAGPRAWRLLQIHRRVRRVRRGQASVADATLLYERMEQVLRKRGYQRPPWLTPQEFSRLLPSEPMTEVVAKFTSAYNDLRFGGKLDAAPQLSILLDQLERQEI
jgi:transglutaminase-like putative cysteine protease